tara:strand:- start:191 stop:2551 length:2361 start_codon:yes stop_codon:yes gene_type:complete
MKKLTYLLIFIFSISTLLAQDFYLNSNGVTCMCPDAAVGDTGVVNGITYTKRIYDQITTENAATTCTSGIDGMPELFKDQSTFNADISSWDVSSVTNMYSMFYSCNDFDQPIGSWDVSSVTNMHSMFGATSFNQSIGDWDVSNVTDMESMFEGAGLFNQPIGNWDVSNVTNMRLMFYSAYLFNQEIVNWDVSNVTDMVAMFFEANAFNQPIGNWNVSNVTDMSGMFFYSDAFNQPIGNWDVSNVTNISYMFEGTTDFNQPIGNWDVSNVTSMMNTFGSATAFNQDIGNWDVSNVYNMSQMFFNESSSVAFNQPIENWDVSSVTYMNRMFDNNNAFNQPLGNWDVSNVTQMEQMFQYSSFNQDLSSWQFNSDIAFDTFIANSGLDTSNYDALLAAFSSQNLLNKTLQAQSLTYCNVSAREDLITNKGWTIEDDIYSSPIINVPNDLNINPNPSSCVAENVDLGIPSVSDGCGDFTISNDAPSEFPIGVTQVMWTIVDGNGNESNDIQSVTVTLQVDVAEVCYVSSDPTEVTNNRIYITTDIDNSGINVAYYEVLREAPSGAYENIGFINPPEVSFLDITSNNTTQAYRYKIKTTDVCGASYPDSSFHKIILLQSGIASDNSINLSWTPYLGLDFSTYNIYKNTNGTGYELLTSLSFNNTTYNDTAANVLDNAYEYYIAIEAPDCNTDPLMTEFIKSNLEYVNPNLESNDFTYLDNAISLFPNPTSGQVKLNTSNDIDIIRVELYNVLGQQITIATNNSIEMSFLPAGLYYLQIDTNLGTVTKTIIRK